MNRDVQLANQYNEVKSTIDRLGKNKVSILCVSKTYPWEDIAALQNHGVTMFGENRAQEAEEKLAQKNLSGLELHFIGHLQRNKVKKVIPYFSWIDSVDSMKLLKEIHKHTTQEGKTMNILFEVNTSQEIQKHGFLNVQELEECLQEAIAMDFIVPRGLMTVGPLTNDPADSIRAFAKLKKLFDTLGTKYTMDQWNTLSMGMSDDYTEAIQEGSTMVRIGSKIFGTRNYG